MSVNHFADRYERLAERARQTGGFIVITVSNGIPDLTVPSTVAVKGDLTTALDHVEELIEGREHVLALPTTYR